jgi:xyloglucan-specific endo-beta-1,4-glucanase
MHFTFVLTSIVSAVAASRFGTPTKQIQATRAQPVASLCTQYAWYSDNGYEILNNLWGMDDASGGSQCTYYNGPAGSGVSISSDWTWEGNPNNVKSYIYANRLFTRPKVSDIKGLPTTVQWSYNTTDIRANVAYDIFTDPDPEHPNYSGEYELMIW